MKIKLNDQVVVISGKSKGKKGKIMRILRKADTVVVEKINIVTKHVKKRENRPGEKIQFEAPIHVSNVMVICPHCNKPTRVKYKKLENKKKERICRKCKETLDKAVKK